MSDKVGIGSLTLPSEAASQRPTPLSMTNRQVFTSRRRSVPAIALWLALVGFLGPASLATAQSLRERRDELTSDFAEQIQQLARWCEERQLDEQARKTDNVILPETPFAIHLGKWLSSRPALPAGAAEAVREWHERFWEIRTTQAESLFALAQQAIREEHVSLAFELIHETLRLDPDHEQARRLLGYQPHEGRWYTAYELRKARLGQVWHERFGWITAEHVPRYEQGERNSGGRWISAEEDAARRKDIRRGWRVETEHFLVQTNHSLEAGVALASRLEKFYDVWWQLFIRYFADASQLQRFFGSSRSPLRSDKQHRVVYFRDAQQYGDAMRRFIPANVKVTSGIYLNDQRTAYFYYDETGDPATIYHEATHQLFAETRPVSRTLGLQANFWIVEGIACYMESFSETSTGVRVGGRDAIRLSDARYRALEDDSYLPLAELVRMERETFQHHPQIAKVYSQSAGLAHFLMHDADGRYRDALVTYVLAVYTGRDNQRTLMQLTRLPPTELDRRYLEYLKRTAP